MARFVVDQMVFVHSPLKKLLAQMTTHMQYLQAHQANPVPYCPMPMSAVQRFTRNWKDMVPLYANERQGGWDEWLPSLAYAYITARNTTMQLVPYAPMMARVARMTSDQTRREAVRAVDSLTEWRKKPNVSLGVTGDEARHAIARGHD